MILIHVYGALSILQMSEVMDNRPSNIHEQNDFSWLIKCTKYMKLDLEVLNLVVEQMFQKLYLEILSTQLQLYYIEFQQDVIYLEMTSMLMPYKTWITFNHSLMNTV